MLHWGFSTMRFAKSMRFAKFREPAANKAWKNLASSKRINQINKKLCFIIIH